MHTILLNPGPVTLSARVRTALTRPDLCHREPEFSELQARLRRRLLEVYALDTAWTAVLLTGSGTAAVEAMLATLVPRDGRVLVLENGVYGERMSRVASAHGIAHERLGVGWGERLDEARVEQALRAARYTHLAVVHHETTTGRLNDLARLGALAAAHGVRLLIDGVSSFGAEALDFDPGVVAACAATANKCLHGVPGTAFVIASQAALAGAAVPARTVYLDLRDYAARQDAGGTPFTQSVQTFYALDEALCEYFEQGGRDARRRLFEARLTTIREVLGELGVHALLPATESSCVLNAFELPPGRSYAELHAALKARGFIIYAGQGALSERVFRISAMGEIGPADLERLARALREALA